MSYFNQFPLIVYPLTHDGKTLVPYTMTDISTRVKFDMPDKDLLTMTEVYQIIDGETIEAVSYKAYGTPYYHWIIMFVNNIFDNIGDWYMTDDQLTTYCEYKYGDETYNPYLIVDDYGNIVGNAKTTTFMNNAYFTEKKYSGNTTVISPKLYEMSLNEKKRLIRLIKPAYITQFINAFKASIAGAI